MPHGFRAPISRSLLQVTHHARGRAQKSHSRHRIGGQRRPRRVSPRANGARRVIQVAQGGRCLQMSAVWPEGGPGRFRPWRLTLQRCHTGVVDPATSRACRTAVPKRLSESGACSARCARWRVRMDICVVLLLSSSNSHFMRDFAESPACLQDYWRVSGPRASFVGSGRRAACSRSVLSVSHWSRRARPARVIARGLWVRPRV